MFSPTTYKDALTKMNFYRNSIFALLIAAVLITAGSFAPGILAQGNTSGGFRGVVRDKATGSPVAGARVVLRNRQFGTQATVITDDNGTYSKGSLPPGDYDIEVSAAGYVTQAKVQTLYAMASYTVEPDPFDMVSETAVVTPPVTVPTDPTVPAPTPTPVAAAADEDPETESISLNPRRVGIFDKASVVGLPLGSTTLTRTFDELAFLVPGVNPPPQAIGNSVGPGVGGGVGTSGQFSVNGLRSRANNFTVDGSDNNDEDIGVRRQGFFSLVPQPIESIQEFQIITLLAPAEFGRNLGAQVNALSKSGANQFHGSFFGFLNSDRLNAPNFFDNTDGDTTTGLTARQFGGTTVPVILLDGSGGGSQITTFNDAGEKDDFTLVQGGFAFGGRLVRNKLFFFVSGEGQELDGTQEKNFAVPTVEQRGLFNSGATGLMTNNGDPVFPTSVGGDAIFSFFPFPNDPTGIYGRNTYTQALSADAKGLILSGRIDWNLFNVNGNQQTFTARYNFTDDERDLTDVGGALFSAIRPLVRTDNFSTFLSGSITNNTSNELRVSWGRTQLEFEELRDTSFLLPTRRAFNDPRDGQFLLNAPLLFNNTLPGDSAAFYSLEGETETELLPFVPGLPNSRNNFGPIGQLRIAGFSPVGVDVFNFPQERENTTFQVADTFRWQTGKHSFSFGGDIRRAISESDLPRNSRPLVTFNGAIDFTGSSQILFNPLNLAAAGAASGFFQSLVLPGRDASIELSNYQLNFFGQDEWRIRPNLHLSLGLRYEYNTPHKEADSKIENSFLEQGNFPPFLSGLSNFINGRSGIYDADKNNLAPRIGLAYSPTSNTVIRAGYGIYYDQILGSVVSQSRNVFPTFSTINFGGGLPYRFCDPSDPECPSTFAFNPFNPLTGFLGTTPIIQPGTINTINPDIDFQALLAAVFQIFPSQGGSSFGATLPQRNLNSPLSHQYSVSVERQIFGNSFLNIGYVGTTGRDLLRFTTPNLGSNYVPVVTDVISSNPGGIGQPIVFGATFSPFSDPATLGRPVPNIGQIEQFETTGRSQYHSLQIGLKGRFNRDLWYQVNYVYGKVKDDVSDVFDLAGASALPQNSLTFDGEYAPANFDIRHRFTYNFIYGLPRLHSWGSPLRHVFGGWELAGTGRFNTGQPFTVNTVYDVNLDGNLTDRLDNLSFLSLTNDREKPLLLSCDPDLDECQSMLAAIGSDGSVMRNNFRAGNVLDLDMAISRRFRLTETKDLQFRIDFFNFVNRANFGVPVRFLEAPGFGRAVDTITPGRRVQFGLKYNF